jgi:hypothetical protein
MISNKSLNDYDLNQIIESIKIFTSDEIWNIKNLFVNKYKENLEKRLLDNKTNYNLERDH